MQALAFASLGSQSQPELRQAIKWPQIGLQMHMSRNLNKGMSWKDRRCGPGGF